MKIHSIADVITNSSTDMFVIHSDENIDKIESLLAEKWEAYKKHVVGWEDRPFSMVITDLFRATNKSEDPYYGEYDRGDIVIQCEHNIPYGFQCMLEEMWPYPMVNRYHQG